LFLTSLFGAETINHRVSLEYSVTERFKLFSLKDIITITIDDQDIEITATGFGTSILDEDLEYKNQNISQDSLIGLLLIKKIVPSSEDQWTDSIFLTDDLPVKVRFLFSEEVDDQRLYRLDIKQLNKENVDNRLNVVVLDSDIIKVWTDKDKNISKISLMYKNVSYVIYIENEE
jgi:hypothetical protein